MPTRGRRQTKCIAGSWLGAGGWLCSAEIAATTVGFVLQKLRHVCPALLTFRAPGFAKVELKEEGPQTTLLDYDVTPSVGGKLAQLDARLIDGVAKSLADKFFRSFVAAVSQPAEV